MNRWDFSPSLNCLRLISVERRCGGREFQTVDAATWKLRRPSSVVTRGSLSFTCHPHTNHTCLYSPAARRHRPFAGTHCAYSGRIFYTMVHSSTETNRTFMKFLSYICLWTKKFPLIFGNRADPESDPVSGPDLPRRRCRLSVCSCFLLCTPCTMLHAK